MLTQYQTGCSLTCSRFNCSCTRVCLWSRFPRLRGRKVGIELETILKITCKEGMRGEGGRRIKVVLYCSLVPWKTNSLSCPSNALAGGGGGADRMLIASRGGGGGALSFGPPPPRVGGGGGRVRGMVAVGMFFAPPPPIGGVGGTLNEVRSSFLQREGSSRPEVYMLIARLLLTRLSLFSQRPSGHCLRRSCASPQVKVPCRGLGEGCGSEEEAGNGRAAEEER